VGSLRSAGPTPRACLLECHRLRIQGAPLGVQKIDASAGSIVVQFIPQPPVDPRRVLALVQNNRIYRCRDPTA